MYAPPYDVKGIAINDPEFIFACLEHTGQITLSALSSRSECAIPLSKTKMHDSPTDIRKDGEEHYLASFTVSDDMFLCKQLFMYGRDVEIVAPPELRKTMVRMLKESRSVYHRSR